jgi:Na+/H+ antiporter NhaD/arsenite permease-like protein
VVFFIFIVSNMGGALTPIGDPPLFLGYLRGIPFFWIFERLWLPWLIAVTAVLSIFAVIDWRNFKKLRPGTRHEAVEEGEEGEVTGLHNIVYLCMILVAVFITDPPFVREGLMILAAAGSYLTTSKEIHTKNHFNFLPIKEVAILFAGIFATMIPALDWLEANAPQLGVKTAGQFYWWTGALSSVLDNAPTYLNFLSAEIGLLVPRGGAELILGLIREHGSNFLAMTAGHGPEIRATSETLVQYHFDMVAAGTATPEIVRISYLLAVHPIYVEAVSLGAVFFGACTYIGNGPNFMVKSIAEQSHVHCPSFFGYVVRYTLPVLLPVFALIWFLFFL